MKQLILGGARSGKSSLAEKLANDASQDVVYIATAQAGDAEMTARIRHHQQTRPAHWRTVEEPLALAAVAEENAAPGRVLLVDCLTLWMTNLLLDADDTLAAETGALLALLPALPGDIIMVSNETGLGVVPADLLSRRFVDETGRLHQRLASICDRVVFTVAGLPQVIKGDAL